MGCLAGNSDVVFEGACAGDNAVIQVYFDMLCVVEKGSRGLLIDIGGSFAVRRP